MTICHFFNLCGVYSGLLWSLPLYPMNTPLREQVLYLLSLPVEPVWRHSDDIIRLFVSKSNLIFFIIYHFYQQLGLSQCSTENISIDHVVLTLIGLWSCGCKSNVAFLANFARSSLLTYSTEQSTQISLLSLMPQMKLFFFFLHS